MSDHRECPGASVCTECLGCGSCGSPKGEYDPDCKECVSCLNDHGVEPDA